MTVTKVRDIELTDLGMTEYLRRFYDEGRVTTHEEDGKFIAVAQDKDGGFIASGKAALREDALRVLVYTLMTRKGCR